MGILALKEDIILSALLILGGSAHGSSIWSKVVEISNQEIVYGTLYNLMEVLIRKGYVTSRKDKPTPERGGKSKTVYSITVEGKLALQETKKLHENIWKALPDIEFGVSD